ncbi:TetR/AcrR family transcriptional regulator C-terminal domain-containing protein [Streptomyces sp. JV176]|uniref:TetR/AcrR family transcriptional regulator n=1 Tax=Streptomyces sp. JV176 TaxID=858630 RepID=UPI002E780AA9|nr:TetR/AcrR family transcriptional regulator C-terminal domain-containing protein [Streptomyces sp. JV176]MEE1803603.1 TetR/AcrR family transcriptional regulator C-terminal domain-containing protein [Streptomyces sp. JV176]
MVSEADSAQRPVRTSVWLEGKPAGRGRRNASTGTGTGAHTGTGTSASTGARTGTDHPHGLDRDHITAVSVRLLDAEGPAKFSMRRLAAELGVTAMSLYWYVDTKDDLLELALDAVFGDVRVPDLTDEDADWRDQLRELAASYRAVLVRHHWVSPLVGKFLNIGPRSMEFSAAVQAVLGRTGLARQDQMGGLAAVFQFVYGFGTIEGHFVQRCADAGLSQDAYFRQAMGAIEDQPGYEGSFDNAGEMMAARGGDTVEEMRHRDFTFALDLLVAGIEAMRDRAAARDRDGRGD